MNRIIFIIALIFSLFEVCCGAAYASREVGFIVNTHGSVKITRGASTFNALNDFMLEASDTLETGIKSRAVIFITDKDRGGIKTVGSSVKVAVISLLDKNGSGGSDIVDVTRKLINAVLEEPEDAQIVIGTRGLTVGSYLAPAAAGGKRRIEKQGLIIYPRGLIIGPPSRILWRDVDEATGYILSITSKDNKYGPNFKKIETGSYIINISKNDFDFSGGATLALSVFRNSNVIASETVEIMVLSDEKRRQALGRNETIAGEVHEGDDALKCFYRGACLMNDKFYSDAFVEFMKFARMTNCRNLSSGLIMAALYGSGYRDRLSVNGITDETIKDIFALYLSLF